MAFGRPVRPFCRSLALVAVLVVRPATGRAQTPAQNPPPTPPPTFKVEVIETDIDHDGKPDSLKVRNKNGYYASTSWHETAKR